MQITENSWGWLYLCFKRSHIKEGYFGAGLVGFFFSFCWWKTKQKSLLLLTKA